MLQNYSTVKKTYGVPESQQALIRAYLQGAVYCWCNTRGLGEENSFQARDFLGGDNFYWERTPMYSLYQYYLTNSNNDEGYAFEEAGKAAGRILKEVLDEDKRIFVQVEGRVASYYWIGEYVEGEQ